MADIVNKVYTPALQLCSQGPLPLVPRGERERGTSTKGTWEGWPVVYSGIWVACVSYFHYAYNKRDVCCTVKLRHLPPLRTPIIINSLLCPWGEKPLNQPRSQVLSLIRSLSLVPWGGVGETPGNEVALIFSLNSTHLIRAPC